MKLPIDSSKNWSKWHERLHKRLKHESGLLPIGSSLLLSISGGQDSMALLKLILDLQKIYQWKINVWHGDHGWHKQSQQISKELELWCNANNVPFVCTKTQRNNVPTENDVREWRYKNLINQTKSSPHNTLSSEWKYILTGHTGSDRAETFIMNLARGANIQGLGSLKECRKIDKKIKLIRPMLIFSREETITICQEMQIPIWEDPSNSNIKFARNYI